MALNPKQQGVLRGIAIGAIIAIVSFVLFLAIKPQWLPMEATMAERLVFALRADLLIILWLGISIARLAKHRFFTPEDIDGGGLSIGTERAKILQATLQNTLEQTVLAVLAHAVWAATVPIEWVPLVVVAVGLYLIGRVLFVRGYKNGASARAVGFALTFYPSMLMLVGCVVWSLVDLF